VKHLDLLSKIFKPPDRDDWQCLLDAIHELEVKYGCSLSPLSWPLARAKIVHLPAKNVNTAKAISMLTLIGLIAYSAYCGFIDQHAYEVKFAVVLLMVLVINRSLSKNLIAPWNSSMIVKCLGVTAALALTLFEMSTALLLPQAKAEFLELLHVAEGGWTEWADLELHKLFLTALEWLLPLVYTVLELSESLLARSWHKQIKQALAHEFGPDRATIDVLFNRAFRQILWKTLVGLVSAGVALLIGWSIWLR
jgi:hypothetical protein